LWFKSARTEDRWLGVPSLDGLWTLWTLWNLYRKSAFLSRFMHIPQAILMETRNLDQSGMQGKATSENRRIWVKPYQSNRYENASTEFSTEGRKHFHLVLILLCQISMNAEKRFRMIGLVFWLCSSSDFWRLRNETIDFSET
jgi:hypothetical protein